MLKFRDGGIQGSSLPFKAKKPNLCRNVKELVSGIFLELVSNTPGERREDGNLGSASRRASVVGSWGCHFSQPFKGSLRV